MVAVPFPDDVPTHPLFVIDYSLIKANDAQELENLWLAATQLGFWYLKNHGSEKEVNDMFDLGAETLDLPLDEKMKFEQGDNGNSFGYKARGKIITDKAGTSDTVEFLNIAQDDALSWPRPTHRTYPAPVNDHMDDIVIPYVQKSMEINDTFLKFFEKRLGLPQGEFNKLHNAEDLNGGEARCIRSPANQTATGVGAHTDFGSLSIVHNRLGGLQVMPPDSDQWFYIKPLPGHAVCNIGDALTLFSAGILRSNVHRVMPPPGEQSKHPRYSISFFTRPGNHIELRALVEKSKIITAAAALKPAGEFETNSTAGQWIARRIRKLRVKNRTGPPSQSWYASMGTEHDGIRERRPRHAISAA